MEKETKNIIIIGVVVFFVFFLVEGIMLQETRYKIDEQSAYITEQIDGIEQYLSNHNKYFFNLLGIQLKNKDLTLLPPEYSMTEKCLFVDTPYKYALANISIDGNEDRVVLYDCYLATASGGYDITFSDTFHVFCIFRDYVPLLGEFIYINYVSVNSEIGTIWYVT